MSGDTLDAPDEYDPMQDMEEQREIRFKYRRLIEEMEEESGKIGTGDRGHHDIVARIEEANRLHEKAKGTSEAALDSRFLLLASEVTAKNARASAANARCFNMDAFNKRIRHFLRISDHDNDGNDDDDHQAADWLRLGVLSGRIFSHVPRPSFALGPLVVEYQKRKVTRAPRERIADEVTVRPEELKANEIGKEENETTKNIRSIYEALLQHNKVLLWKFVINPQSFSQTVENIFYCAFLGKEGRLGVETMEDGDALIYARVDENGEEEGGGMQESDRFQHMLTLDMSSYRELIDQYDIRRSTIPTRTSLQEPITGRRWY